MSQGMKLDTVIKNLDNTIRGKELLRLEYCNSGDIAARTAADFIAINLKELRAIRDDLLKISS